MNSPKIPFAALGAKASDDFVANLVLVSGEQARSFVAGGAIDVLLTVEPVPLAIDVQVRGLGRESIQCVGTNPGSRRLSSAQAGLRRCPSESSRGFAIFRLVRPARYWRREDVSRATRGTPVEYCPKCLDLRGQICQAL